MEKKEIKAYLNQRIRIVLKSGYQYHGYILNHGNDFLRLRDKFNKIVLISTDQIALIEEWNNEL